MEKSYKREASCVVMGLDLVFWIMAAFGRSEAIQPAQALLPYATVLFAAAFGFDAYIKQLLPAKEADK